jgi:asparagine synthase (glutamine-hydrolysing)
MCGIAGIAGFGGKPVFLDEVQTMCDALYHRGPDDCGYYESSDVVLGMRRLSIIDLHTGRQPISNEDGSVSVVFNGEIYNFAELRKDLEKQGHRFSTATDTEVIVHSYEQYGAGCVDRFRGMFAFAVWDERTRQLMIARDRLGIKPLYYGMVKGRLVFASELKAILQLSDVDRTLDWRSVSHLFSFLTTPKDAAIVAGIKKLEPGHRMLCSPGREPVIERYWDVEFRPDCSKSEGDFVEEFRALLEESVRLRLIADVPLGAFLSGGLDSSSVVATMARLCSRPVKTFSIGFEEAEYSELDSARKVATYLGTDHYELMLAPNVLGVIEDITASLDEPFGDSSAIPTYMVSKLAAEHVKVVLSGDGGDELFAGYDKYLVEQRERRRVLTPFVRGLLAMAARSIPEGARGANYLRHFSLSCPERYLDASTLFRADQKENLFTPAAARYLQGCDPTAARLQEIATGRGDWLSLLQIHDLKNYLPLDILTKVDRMSMAHSIEARVPLLDHKLVEFAATVPADMRLRGITTKYIFKQAMRGILPDEIIDRPKRGFAIPLGQWFRGRLASFASDLLLSAASRQRGILNPRYIQKLLAMHGRGRNLDMQVWTLISFEMWCRKFLDQRPAPIAIQTMPATSRRSSPDSPARREQAARAEVAI